MTDPNLGKEVVLNSMVACPVCGTPNEVSPNTGLLSEDGMTRSWPCEERGCDGVIIDDVKIHTRPRDATMFWSQG
jgi:hypothetical protein